MDWKNKLYFGDNLDILRREVPDASVDLIYLDPPFNSNATYNVLFKEKTGEESAAQITAFEDTWQWSVEAEAVYKEIVTSGPRKLADLMQALLAFLGRNDMMAYLVMMAIRLVELHRVLKPTGGIYLHCDPTASHYLKLVLDAVFRPENFRNEIVWKRTSARSDSHRWNHIHDIIFFYTRSADFTWNAQFTSYDSEYVKGFYSSVEPDTNRPFMSDNLTAAGVRHGESGKPWRGVNPTKKGRHWALPARFMQQLGITGATVQDRLEALDKAGRIIWPDKEGGVPRYKRYLDDMPGLAIQSIIADIPPLSAQSAEKLGYPTQKPEALLERIIKASSNEGDLVLDPFCGCGTAIAVAERLKRRWIGIDITYLAINLVQRRLRDTFHNDLSPYEIIGAPTDVQGAEALKEISPHQFEWWAVDLVNARPAKDHKKGADTGIDGYINFFDDKSGQAKQVIVQVKSGYIGVNHVRDLKGVLEREKAPIGVLITLREPTKPMLTEAAATGFYESKDFPGRYPRLQIFTVAELLAGKKLEYPAHRVETFAKAERKSKSEQDSLF
ncbi:MAG: DNA methyltransferase [Terriglobia bacterium]|jgi:site-specific DNA-methyltransferase (adenine-specific)